MAHRTVVPLDLVIVSDDEHGGHTVSLYGIEIAYRAYDGSDDDDVASKVVAAFGGILLERLECAGGQSALACGLHPGTWSREKPEGCV